MKKQAMLYEKLENDTVHCFLCNHHCRLSHSEFGFCQVRQNIKGTLYTHVYGELITQHVDPIEKKPFSHFQPGTMTYSIATPGCNFHCGFCQNWQISQFTQDKKKPLWGNTKKPEEIVTDAQNHHCKSIAYTYTEPTIFFEYAYDTAILAKKHKLSNVFVTNGYMTKKAIDKITPYLDAANIDLKSFRNEFYKKHCKATLQPVLDTITYMEKKGIWIEITTLLVPDQNDSEEELSDIARFISNINNDIPWHISRFYPDYKYNDLSPTPYETLTKAKEIGEKYGLKQIQIGNV